MKRQRSRGCSRKHSSYSGSPRFVPGIQLRCVLSMSGATQSLSLLAMAALLPLLALSAVPARHSLTLVGND
jgi:hypothetical protein